MLFPHDVGENHRFWSLGNILSRALVEKLRLAGGRVYDVQAQAEATKAPHPHATVRIVIPCAPQDADQLAALALDEVRRLRREGPTKQEVRKEVESQRRAVEKERQENERWLGKLEMVYRHEEALTRLSAPEKLIALVTAPELQAMAQKYLDPDKFARATLVPESPSGTPAK